MVTQTAVYALRALLHLAHEPEDDYHQTVQIARRIHVPSNYLGKILQKLARAKIVESQKGLHGGFRLAKLPEQVRLLDVFRALDSLSTTAYTCPLRDDADAELAALQRRLANFDRLYTRFLNDTTLSDLLAVNNEDDVRRLRDAVNTREVEGLAVLSI